MTRRARRCGRRIQQRRGPLNDDCACCPRPPSAGAAMLFSATDLTDEQRDLVSILGKGVKQISLLVSDVLDFSALTSGQFPIDERRLGVREDLIEGIWKMVRIGDWGLLGLWMRVGGNALCTCLVGSEGAAAESGVSVPLRVRRSRCRRQLLQRMCSS